jgi:superfamily II DNA or RNA helicase
MAFAKVVPLRRGSLGLSDRTRRVFSGGVRARGESYFASDAVRIAEQSADMVRAIVRGTRSYTVEIEARGVGLVVSCTCPYYVDREIPCKHLWATLRALDGTGALSSVGDGSGEIRVRPRPMDDEPASGDADDDFADDWHDDEEDEYDGEESPSAFEPSLRQREEAAASRRTAITAGDRVTNRAPGARRGEGFQTLAELRALLDVMARDGEFSPSVSRKPLWYLVDRNATIATQALVLRIREPAAAGRSKWRLAALSRAAAEKLPDATDRRIASLLLGARRVESYSSYEPYGHPPDFSVDAALHSQVLPAIATTGRCLLLKGADESALAWDDGDPWQLVFRVTSAESGKSYRIEGLLGRGADAVPLESADLVLASGFVFLGGRVSPFAGVGGWPWVTMLRRGPITVPEGERRELLELLHSFEDGLVVELPDDMRLAESAVTPRPALKISEGGRTPFIKSPLIAELSFDYEGVQVPASRRGSRIVDARCERLVVRDRTVEGRARARLFEVGLREPRWSSYGPNGADALRLAAGRMPQVVRTLVSEGWHVEAEGKLFRRAGRFDITVTSGIDWFELGAAVDFDGKAIAMPRLLQALSSRDGTIALDDGTLGILPEEWLARYRRLSGFGTLVGEAVRFKKTQAVLLDALLATEPEAELDAGFERARTELRRFDRISAVKEPSAFRGTLRGYQRDGLGWLLFLRRFGFGGCLADDMGLGKTIQVLALFTKICRGRKTGGAALLPSLVVAPRSLIFNWQAEAKKFTPALRVLDHTGIERKCSAEHFANYDVVLTTYGTLRRDAVPLSHIQFDTAVLDEAQAIKNGNSDTAKAARLIRAEHRLALSGTPIENHIGELWSLFEFLNPGLLGRSSALSTGAGRAKVDDATRDLVARALRPLLLRRTKAQVAPELPERVEQTLYIDLERREREMYDELRDHYRAALLRRIDRDGIGRSTMHVLEALLRLRQAACHPGLVDKRLAGEQSSKLDLLLDRLQDVREEGHKALVFSQFTTLLGMVRRRLDAEKIPHEYLDGRTRDRSARVERFQTDPSCPLFLVSLKAGGLGLNLTAAEYVFLLDPWWNPAVEAQAIDRAHRIGQTRPVFAYRLIAKNTVEERVADLQQQKRELADAILRADGSLIGDLGRDDLELLLS